jgi:DNA uptake protein ComE-like DNA-binding protein
MVPFMGAYRINTFGAAMVELNSVSMDSFFAEDSDTTNDTDEEVGRFCPLTGSNNYDWAQDVFDYFSATQNPNKDFLPNVDATLADTSVTPAIPARYPGGVAPAPVRNTSSSAANSGEDEVPNEGLININTAPWKVLARLPMLSDPAANELLAKAIETHRNTNGAFTNVFELYNVAGFVNPGGDPDDDAGDFSPLGAGTDGVSNDFEQKYLLLNRISNLVTTRSDSFTVYIVVQAWQDANDAGNTYPTRRPVLLDERRAAFIVDRSGISQTNNTAAALKLIDVATD